MHYIQKIIQLIISIIPRLEGNLTKKNLEFEFKFKKLKIAFRTNYSSSGTEEIVKVPVNNSLSCKHKEMIVINTILHQIISCNDIKLLAVTTKV